MATIEIEIDGKKITAEAGKTLIQIADENKIYIPRFCYHPKLNVAANCRMCLVEAENARKPLPACATPATDGMKIYTQSATTQRSQQAVMSFLLINHPLDCPICDQGGQCDLQDLAMGYGLDRSTYTQPKHCVSDENLGPLIATNMTRCIKCTRCVRFGDELAGLSELGLMGRGETVNISTYVQHFLQSEVSGNIIDLCPVGALLSKPFLYRARPWELTERPTIAAHDCLGSHTYAHSRRGQVMRVVPRTNEAINEIWLSDRDRFSYLGNHTPQRLTSPMIKNGDKWECVSFERAFKILISRFNTILKREGGTQLGALLSPSATLETGYLLQKLLRALGSNNIDHRLRQTDFTDQQDWPLFLGIEKGTLEHLSKKEVVFLVGSDICQEQPLAALKLRQAIAQGGKVASLNVLQGNKHLPLTHQWIVPPHAILDALGQIAKQLCMQCDTLDHPASETVTALFAHCKPSHEASNLATLLLNAKAPLILLGAFAHNHPEAAKIRQVIAIISKLTGAQLGFMTEGANSAGATIAGAIPHRTACGKPLPLETEEQHQQGLTASEMIKQGLKIFLTVGIDPELDCANSQATLNALRRANLTVCLTPYMNPTMQQYADILLPITTHYEMAGTLINVEGTWQRFSAVARPEGDARPAWKIIRVLADQLGLEGFNDYDNSQIYDELLQQFNTINPGLSPPKQFQYPTHLGPTKHFDSRNLQRISQVPIYRTDAMVRHAEALQTMMNTTTVDPATIRLHPKTAQYYHLEMGDQARVTQNEISLVLPIMIDPRVPQNCLWIDEGLQETIGLGGSFDEITLEPLTEHGRRTTS